MSQPWSFSFINTLASKAFSSKELLTYSQGHILVTILVDDLNSAESSYRDKNLFQKQESIDFSMEDW